MITIFPHSINLKVIQPFTHALVLHDDSDPYKEAVIDEVDYLPADSLVGFALVWNEDYKSGEAYIVYDKHQKISFMVDSGLVERVN